MKLKSITVLATFTLSRLNSGVFFLFNEGNELNFPEKKTNIANRQLVQSNERKEIRKKNLFFKKNSTFEFRRKIIWPLSSLGTRLEVWSR